MFFVLKLKMVRVVPSNFKLNTDNFVYFKFYAVMTFELHTHLCSLPFALRDLVCPWLAKCLWEMLD